MVKPLFDADALIAQFESATARQGPQMKKAASDATLAALRGRELTLKNIRGALQQVAGAASAGVAKNVSAGVDPGALLDKAVAGMDEALLKAVAANQTALQTLMAQGADLRDKHLQTALGELDKLEDSLFGALKKAAASAGAPMASAWGPVLEKMQAGGSLSGAQAAQTTEDMAAKMADQMQAALRSGRSASVKAASALAQSYTAMVSGVLIGMSEAMQGSVTPPTKDKSKTR